MLARKKTSFFNSWSKFANSDLLEECCVRVQILGFFLKGQILFLQILVLFHSEFKIPGSNVNFVRGIPSNQSIASRSSKQDSDENSIVSTRIEDFKNSESEDQEEEETVDDFSKEFSFLFQTEEA